MTAKPKKTTVRVNSPIRLKCTTDENVRLSHIKWLHNGHRLDESITSEMIVDKKVHHDHIYTTLFIKHASANDAGVYVCKFGQTAGEKIFVDVVVGDEKVKSSGK